MLHYILLKSKIARFVIGKISNFVTSNVCVCVCVCVCVFVPMPTHCTITRFEFHARRIDGVKCGIFSNHVPFVQTTLRVGRVSV